MREDIALLKRMATVNLSMGDVVIGMLGRQDLGRLDAEDLRLIGRNLVQLGADILMRADALDNIVEADVPPGKV
jgi:hypothetical protein